MRRIPVRETMLTASATAVSAGVRVTDFRNCILSIAGSANNANLKVFIKGAIGDVAPDFTVLSSARSPTNNWDRIEVVDLQDGTALDGDVGINLNGDVIRLIEVNINSLDWLAVHATGILVGTVTVTGNFTTNE